MDFEFEWDNAKERSNINKHGITFAAAARVFADENRVETFDCWHSDEQEERWNVLGMASNGVLFVVYTERTADVIRIISARKASSYERKKYYAEFQQILADELPVYWLFAGPYHTVANVKIGNPPNGIWGTSSPLDRVYIK